MFAKRFLEIRKAQAEAESAKFAHVSYAASPNCKLGRDREDVCFKCGKCGRKFDKNGIMK